MSQFLSSNELFINIKNPPQWNPRKSYYEQDIDVLDFYLEEKRKITEGITIGGYYIHPWLYWHMNFFKTPIPQGKGVDKVMNPPLDDNFLYIIESYQEAEEKNLGLALFGTRGFGKSQSLSSLITWLNTTKPTGITSVYGGEAKDLRDISKLIQTGFNNIHPAFFIPQLISDWENNVELGIKEKDGFRLPYSYMNITNASLGSSKKSEKGAGGSPVGFILDEALHEDSLIYYDGYEKPIKEVEIGDMIYGANGRLTTVLSKINPGIVNTWKIKLKDGREIISSENHKWKVYDTRYDRWKIITTKDILKKYYYEKYDSRYDKKVKSFIYSLPISSSVEYSKKNLKVDPYWLGLWLGDGSKSSTSVCSIDQDIVNYCRNYALSLGMECYVNHPTNVPNINFFNCNIVTQLKNRKTHKNKLREWLRDYGVFDEKDIPSDYLYSDSKDRLELLQGLMDTDGTCTARGHIQFSTSSPNLAKSFEKLCRSLGIHTSKMIRPSHYLKDGVRVYCKETYKFTLYTDLKVFKLQRKLDNYNISKGNNNSKKQKAYKERVMITEVEYIGSNQVYCLGVDNEEKLFLTEDYVVTHNCGKFSFRGIWESASPAFFNEFGARLVPILSGTSGNKELSQDAKDVFSNPEAYNLLPMNWDRLDRNIPEEFITWKGSKRDQFSTFVPGQMTYRINELKKVDCPLGKYLKIEDDKLNEINIRVTDWEKATNTIKEKVASHKKIESQEKERMYFPLELADVFLTESANPFPTAVIDRHIRRLEDEGKTGKDIDIFKTAEGKNKAEFVNKKRAAVSHGGGEADAPIVLFGELPEIPPARHIFVSGLDDYKLDLSDTDSLGAFYVIKRRNLEPNQPCETIAASYVARPYNHRDLHATCEKMIEVWDAECNMESADISFVQHLDLKGKAMKLLTPAFSFATTISNNQSKLNSRYGVYPTTANKAYMFNLLIDFCKEEHVMDIDEDGNQIIKYGVEFIDDIDLLKEMMSFKKGGNFDRITAFMHALALARELDKKGIAPIDRRHDQLRKDQMKNRPKVQRTVFSSNTKRKTF